MDVFLARLIIYFQWFMEKKELKNKDADFHIAKSAKEKKKYSLACEEVRMNRKLLAHAYINILLGLGQCKTHHIQCGKSKSSDSHEDRVLYETLFKFAAVFVWVGMGRKDFDLIRSEINRHAMKWQGTLTVGIIGESLHKYNPINLSPLDLEDKSVSKFTSKPVKSNMEKYLETRKLQMDFEDNIKQLKIHIDDFSEGVIIKSLELSF
ncbi:hypothetical protein HELRODRAFT_168908 [Helobdella robusta]|uniref:Uncharacterized protein n=1 Tax=Helobdella robusta TaxID=6412 RepID=T1F143_HELRO|nr:hypothetical protein HELRODRAFT_168908 [Helobdella robusta]ESO08979.1 hypothetical protein HELRODRAFT_168908 [Helobdella robusta]